MNGMPRTNIFLVVSCIVKSQRVEGYRISVEAIDYFYPSSGDKNRTVVVLRGADSLVIDAPLEEVEKAIKSAWSATGNVAFVKVIYPVL